MGAADRASCLRYPGTVVLRPVLPGQSQQPVNVFDVFLLLLAKLRMPESGCRTSDLRGSSTPA
jgi:hypothetical protein